MSRLARWKMPRIAVPAERLGTDPARNFMFDATASARTKPARQRSSRRAATGKGKRARTRRFVADVCEVDAHISALCATAADVRAQLDALDGAGSAGAGAGESAGDVDADADADAVVAQKQAAASRVRALEQAVASTDGTCA